MQSAFSISGFDYEDYKYIFENRSDTAKTYYKMNEQHHISVLLEESVSSLNLRDDGVYIDATFGAGGHSRKILQSSKCKLIAIDRDSYTKKFADELSAEFGDRFSYHNTRFSNIDEVLKLENISGVDGILFDFGFSSMQIDTPRRGFSFQSDGPLDMRMEDNGQTAEDFVNSASQEELAGIIFKFGDERKSRAIAKAIINARTVERITRTKQLSDIVRAATGSYNDAINPATRTFQAIRIFINNEFEEIEMALEKAKSILNSGGILSCITFHSGEDIIVKSYMRENSGYTKGVSRYLPAIDSNNNNFFKIITKKPVEPSHAEVKRNVRARSAKLRVAQRTEVKI